MADHPSDAMKELLQKIQDAKEWKSFGASSAPAGSLALRADTYLSQMKTGSKNVTGNNLKTLFTFIREQSEEFASTVAIWTEELTGHKPPSANTVENWEEFLETIGLNPAKPRPPPLSLEIWSVHHKKYYCVVRDQPQLRDLDLLPMPPDVKVKIQVSMSAPCHFCLFSFGPDLDPNLVFPKEECFSCSSAAIHKEKEAHFSGIGGSECLLLLSSTSMISDRLISETKKRLKSLLGILKALPVQSPRYPFSDGDPLAAATTKKLDESSPGYHQLEHLMAEVRTRFGNFEKFHFLAVQRLDPPPEPPWRPPRSWSYRPTQARRPN